VNISDSQIKNLEQIALNLRRNIIKMIQSGQGGHLGGSLSCIEIITALYFSVLRCKPQDPQWEDRDRFILSAGHKCLALYSVLAEKGHFDKKLLNTYDSLDSPLPGHPDRHKLPGVEANTGSLGHGLALGGGMALAGKIDQKDYKVYVLMGDGEIAEGSVWEAAEIANHYKLDHLIAIIDRNKLQIQGNTKDILNTESLTAKWNSFGWQTFEVDGHDFVEIFRSLENIPNKTDHPTCIIANTIKGKGLSFAENNYKYHYWKPTEEEMKKAFIELGMNDL
jgi:transketolase